ncbi:MAG: hypothetical protein DWQ37_00250 [Planctomycetota bacterium]|nr:MAG: hypothetical protein DWQ37_00250 [Planctomycetota bacterium]
MNNDDERTLGQWQLRHLFGLLTIAAALLAMVAPLLRRLEPERQVEAALKILVAAGAAGGIVVFLAIRRQKLEQQGGPMIARFERRSSRIWSGLIVCVLVVSYAASVVVDELDAAFSPISGSPWLLYLAVNYAVVRFWWRIDPLSIEAREGGLILGSVFFRPWEEISRYTFSGSPPRQLNLFVTSPLPMVMNIKVDTSGVERLDEILAQHVAAPRSAGHLAAAATQSAAARRDSQRE